MASINDRMSGHFLRLSNRCLYVFSILYFLLAVWLVFGCYFKIGQSLTADEPLTLNRYQAVAKGETRTNHGELVSYFLIAKHSQEARTNSVWISLLPRLVFGQYTKYFKPIFVQISICIFIIALSAWIIATTLTRKLLQQIFSFLFCFVTFMSYPMLRGLMRVLKYDAFSNTFILLMLSAYACFVISGKRNYFLLSIIAGTMAFLEKDTSALFVTTIFAFEIFRYVATTSLEPIKHILNRVLFLVVLGVFASSVTIFAVVPAARQDFLSFLSSALNSEVEYARALPIHFVVIVPFLGLFSLIGIRWLIKSVFTRPLISYFSISKIFGGTIAIYFILGIAGLCYQANDMFRVETLGYPLPKDIFHGPSMAGTSITTFDKSAIVTFLRLFFSEARIYFYQIPEAILLSFPFALFVLLRRGNPSSKFSALSSLVKTLIAWSVTCGTSIALSYAPIEGKYLVPINLGIIITVCLVFISWLSVKTKPIYNSIFLVIYAALLLPALSFQPDDAFAFTSILRDMRFENSDFLVQGKSVPWTWAGWGETSFDASQWIDRQGSAKSLLIYDDVEPAAPFPKIQFVKLSGETRSSSKILASFTCASVLPGLPAYFLITKNIVYRATSLNLLLQEHRNQSLATFKAGGMELAWIFDARSVIKWLGTSCKKINEQSQATEK